MVAFDNSVSPAASTTTRYYGACPERSRENDQRIVLRTSVDSGGVESDSRTFVFGNYIDEVLIMRLPSGSDFYYAHDHLYSPTVLYGNTGSIILRYEYDAYGKRDQYTAAWVPSTIQIFGNPFAFTGRELDYLDGGNLNLMHYRARTYDPQIGRFMQRDPLGINPAGGLNNPLNIHGQYRDSMNLYQYVKSAPSMYSDSTGLKIYPNSSSYNTSVVFNDAPKIKLGIIKDWMSDEGRAGSSNGEWGIAENIIEYEIEFNIGCKGIKESPVPYISDPYISFSNRVGDVDGLGLIIGFKFEAELDKNDPDVGAERGYDYYTDTQRCISIKRNIKVDYKLRWYLGVGVGGVDLGAVDLVNETLNSKRYTLTATCCHCFPDPRIQRIIDATYGIYN